MENPVVNKKCCYHHCCTQCDTEGLTYSEFRVKAVSERFPEIKDLIETDKDEETSESDSEIMKTNKSSL